ncbi:LPXTG cell wall anchor domain-containing protein, partial [Enterococcus gilvus]
SDSDGDKDKSDNNSERKQIKKLPRTNSENEGFQQIAGLGLLGLGMLTLKRQENKKNKTK